MTKTTILSVVVLVVVVMGVLVSGEEGDGSRTRPAHRIPLIDENGEEISPHDLWAMPFSARETCGPCHDYDTIAQGWHFNSHDASVPAGRKGEPWVLVDEATGTQLPVSNRAWDGAWSPEDLGLSPWKFVQRFGRHMPGGNWGEVARDVPDIDSRWPISGRLEINCLACHNASPEQSQSDWVIQCARENFRWAATAASGLGVVGGVASRLPDSWDLVDGPDPDNAYVQPPSVVYSAALFDAKNRPFVDLDRHGSANRCYFCHSTQVVGEEHGGEDVHLSAGLTCTDCHRNALAHDMVRGNEAAGAGPEVTTLSCRGCHYGDESADGPEALGGHLGALRPEHRGMPPLHLEEMACTTCHAGPWPKAETGRVRTARANRLGVHGKAEWDTDLPQIVSPVYLPDEDGLLAPHHVLWPSFWARIEDDAVRPLLPEDVMAAAEEFLTPGRQVARVLAALASLDDPAAIPVYVVDGRMYQHLAAGRLTASDAPKGVTGPRWGLLKDGEVLPVVLDTLTWTVEALLAPKADLTRTQMAKVLAEVAYQGLVEGDAIHVAGGVLCRWTDEETLVVSDAPEGVAPGWGDFTEEGVTPIEAGALRTAVEEMIAFEQPLTEEGIAKKLAALVAVDVPGGEPVYLSGGKLYRLAEEEGTVRSEDSPAGAPRGPRWGLLAQGGVMPLVPDHVSEALSADGLTETQVRLVLAALAVEDPGQPVYVAGGKLSRLNGDALVSEDHEAAAPYTWTFGHDVRPAAQSLGAAGCTDCHEKDAPFFFAQVAPASPAQLATAPAAPAHALQGYDGALVAGWARTVWLGPLTTALTWCGGALVAFALLRYGFLAIERILRALVGKGERSA